MSIIFTGLRVPAAYLISSPDILGLNGYWWSITLSSVVKGTLAVIMISFVTKKLKLMKYREIEAPTFLKDGASKIKKAASPD